MRVSQHYQGSAGERYYAWQRQSGDLGASLNARKFAPHVLRSDAVVDFGCGGGFLLRQLQCRERIGIEPNNAARDAATKAGTRTVAHPSELAADTADIVISNHALEHTTEPLGELRELLRILKPGKKLVMWLPMDDWRNQRKVDPDDVNFHLYTWTPQLLHNLLTEAGFEVQDVSVISHSWPPGVRYLGRLPQVVFDRMCRLRSILSRQRQIRAIAVRPSDPIRGDGPEALTAPRPVRA